MQSRRTSVLLVALALLLPACGSAAAGSHADAGALLGDGGLVSADDGGPPVDPTDAGPVVVDVRGTVVDHDGVPLAGRMVQVRDAMTTTDAEGRFALDDVTAPYDVIVATPGSTQVRVAAAQTTPTPVIATGYREVHQETTIGGIITGLPAPSDGSEDRFGISSDFNGETSSRHANNTFGSVLARWWGPPTATHHALFVRMTEDADGMPLAYHGIGALEVQLTGGVPVTGVTIPAVDPGESTITGSVVMPANVVGQRVQVFAAMGRANAIVADVDTPSFEVLVPSGAGVTAGVTATAYTSTGPGLRFAQNLPTSSTGLELRVPAPPELLEPAAGADDVVPGDAIRWRWTEPNAIYVVEIGVSDGDRGWAPYIQLVTTETSCVIPDLSSLGIAWTPGRSVGVWIYAYSLAEGPARAQTFDHYGFLGTVWGSDGMAIEDGSLAFLRDGVFFTSGS